MAFSFDVASNIPRLNQSGTDTGLSGIATAINAVVSVARSTAYTTAMLRKPPTPTGFWYRCSTAGTTASTAPTYGTTLGGTTTDGTSVWTAFKAPDIQTLGTTNHYYMPDVRMAINGTLTNSNPQQQNFTCYDIIIYTGNFTSGAWASDGVTPLYDGLHFATVRTSGSGADGVAMSLQAGGQFTFIGGEVQVANGPTFDSGTTPRSYYTRWRNTKDYGVTSGRFRSSSATAIFRQCEFYDMAFDRFNSPAEFSAKARGSEYLVQYVGSGNGGVAAKFTASGLENVDGTYDFDNYSAGWCELYNCAKGANLNVVTQNPTTGYKNAFFVPLYQDIRITAKDTSGAVVQNVRFNCTDVPNNSPTTIITTFDGLKAWDYRNPLSYQTTTDASGIALSTPSLQAWWFNGSAFQKNLRFPLSTATYQGRAYNYKTMNVSLVLGSNSIQDVSAGMVSLDTATTVTESVAGALTGISLVPSGATGGVITISSNKTLQDVWNYYRYWISQFANKTSNDTWTCTGGILDSKLWTLVVNSGVTLSGTSEITQYKTSGTVTNNGTITAVYGDVNGTSTIWEFGATAEPIIAGTSLAIYDSTGTTKYYNAVTSDGVYRYYIAPQSTGATYTYAIERYGYKREEGTFPSNAGGILFYVPSYSEDVGITEATKATVAAYTTLADTAQIYDATANFRLSETGIKLGQLVARDGTYLDFGNFNVKIKDDASAIVAVSSGTITYKSIVINESTKYNAMKATPPKTITPTDTEIINVLIEDANGDSKLAILGGDNLGYELWKIPTATATDDYATGTLLDTLTTNDEVFRFIGISGYDIVGRDISSGVRRRTSMLKGSYEQAFYVGNQIQLATDAPQLIDTNNKIDELILKVDSNLDVKVSTRLADADYIDPATAQDVWEYTTRTLTSAGSSGATLAEIEGSLILAKEATSQDIKTKVLTLNNYDDATTQTKLDALQTTVNDLPTLAEMEANTSNIAKQDALQGVSSSLGSLENSLDSIAGNDFDAMNDSLDAISTKVDEIKAKTDVLVNTDLTGIATTENVTDAKDEILTEIVNIPATDLTNIEADLNIINEGVQKSSLFIPHVQDL